MSDDESDVLTVDDLSELLGLPDREPTEEDIQAILDRAERRRAELLSELRADHEEQRRTRERIEARHRECDEIFRELSERAAERRAFELEKPRRERKELPN